MTFNTENPVQIKLPFIGIYDMILLPCSDVRIDFTRQAEIKALKLAEDYQSYVVLSTECIDDIVHEHLDGFYRRGVLAKIILSTSPNSSLSRVKFDIIMRCDILELNTEADCTMALVETVPSITTNIEESTPIKSLIKKELEESKNKNTEDQVIYQKISMLLSRDLSDDILSDSIASLIAVDAKSRSNYLFELDTNKRLLNVLTDLRKHKFYDELEAKIDNDVRKNMNEQQKEYFLREKMRAIQEELGDKALKDADIEKLRKKIKESSLPKSVEEKCLNELSRYQITPSSSPEAGIIKTYLDFVLSLPWSLSSEDSNDLNVAKEILDEDHYGLDKVKDRIIEYLAVRVMSHKNPQSILCLVGPPGVGKTSLAMSVARALNKKFVKQSLGGVADESEIRGHRRTYIGALPGRIMQSLSKAKTNNPVFLLDEIDKLSSDYKGDPTSAMLEVLDPEQNKTFSDHYLEEPFDLSNVFFIATANYLGNIPAPLRDRLEIIELSSYTEHEKFEIAHRHLIDKQLKQNGLDKDLFSITDEAIYLIIRNYTREAGVREVERLIGSLIRKVMRDILVKKISKAEISKDNIQDYLGKFKFENNEAIEQDYVGVVNGLAYTEYGGDTLQIEVAHYPGNGRVLITGKLGDVMKESAETALSYVKANASDFLIKDESFNNTDIHIHVPEGAVPKDGPSAGVTMVTAIVSSFSNRAVNHLIGMTGEITLRGRVLPIGGLKEKSIAAARSGLKKILVPKENEKDLEQIPQTVKEQLEIVLISDAKEAIKEALI